MASNPPPEAYSKVPELLNVNGAVPPVTVHRVPPYNGHIADNTTPPYNEVMAEKQHAKMLVAIAALLRKDRDAQERDLGHEPDEELDLASNPIFRARYVEAST